MPRIKIIYNFRGVAQLVARLVRVQEAVGSTPATPTSKKPETLRFQAFLFCLQQHKIRHSEKSQGASYENLLPGFTIDQALRLIHFGRFSQTAGRFKSTGVMSVAPFSPHAPCRASITALSTLPSIRLHPLAQRLRRWQSQKQIFRLKPRRVPNKRNTFLPSVPALFLVLYGFQTPTAP